jgi:hypothetical protein
MNSVWLAMIMVIMIGLLAILSAIFAVILKHDRKPRFLQFSETTPACKELTQI